jgi:hypothetical protein
MELARFIVRDFRKRGCKTIEPSSKILEKDDYKVIFFKVSNLSVSAFLNKESCRKTSVFATFQFDF